MCHLFNLYVNSLPPEFKYENITTPENSAEEYTLRANLQNDADILTWIRAFGASTKTQWNVKRTRPTSEGGTILFKEFVCHHSSFMKVAKDDDGYNRRGISKNASCEARIRISINVVGSKRSRDPYVRIGLLAKIRITRKHTHTLNSAKTLRFLQCKDGTLRETFLEYFDNNMIASEAKHFHEHKLTLKNATEQDFSNGNINPTSDTVFYWFQQWRLLHLGPRSGSQLIAKLREKQIIYAEKGIILEFREDPLCVLVSTPLMQRAHALPSAGNLLFVDSTSACDAGRHSVTFLLTPCAAGAVPLGVLITSGQSTEAYSKAFQLTNVIPGRFGNCNFPKTILTDNSAVEIAAIRETWPDSTNLLCTFHILQAVWRWLWDSANGVMNDHRVILMNAFKAILYSQNLIEMESAYANCLQTGIDLKYKKWIQYLEEYYKFKEKWVLAYRDETMRGHHTNNFSEISIRIFKDVDLARAKAYNVIALIHFCVTSLEEYYIGKLRNFSNFHNQESFNFFRKNLRKVTYLQQDDIIQVDEKQILFLVPSENNRDLSYTVDCEVGSCTCCEGKYGKFCKHQCAVYQFFQINAINFPSISAADRYEMAKIALGANAPPPSFYEEFNSPCNEMVPSCAQTLLPQLFIHTPFQEIRNTSNLLPPLESPPPENALLNNSLKSVASLLEEKNELIKSIENQFKEKVNCFPTSVDIINALKKYSKSLDRITTEGLLLKFLHSCPIALRRCEI